LSIKSSGDPHERLAHRNALATYFQSNFDKLDENSKLRVKTNPLRILDSKKPEMQSIIAAAPKLVDHLDGQSKSRQHFLELQAMLKEADVPFEVNPRLVRGLDYYNRTVFEWITDRLGAQGTVAGGGRYDFLFSQLGGEQTHACGFAVGVERLVLLLHDAGTPASVAPLAYVVHVGSEATSALARRVAEALRDAGLAIVVNAGGGSFKAQMKSADASGARWALIVGDNEAAANRVAVKPLRAAGEQVALAPNELAAHIRAGVDEK
jgi:histidyl-tRNA synthetase